MEWNGNQVHLLVTQFHVFFPQKMFFEKKYAFIIWSWKSLSLFLDNFTIICDQIIFRYFFMYIWEVKCMGWPYLGAMEFIWYYHPSWNWSPVQMYYKLYNLQSTLVALASAHWSYGFEFHYHTKDLGKWFLWIYRRRRQSTKRNRFFFIEFQNINESASKFINAANKTKWLRFINEWER